MKIVAAAIGLTFVAFALAEVWSRARGDVAESWPWLLAAAIPYLVALWLFARCWAVLFEQGESPRLLHRSFLVGQLGKYVPGSVWQAAGQVALARNAGVRGGQAAALYPIFMLCVTVAGATLATTLVFFDLGSGFTRLLSLAGLATVPLLHRSWMTWLLERAHRFFPKLRGTVELPSQRAILRSYGWSVSAITGMGVSFALIVVPLSAGEVPFTRATAAFTAAWTLGFVAVPFPAGLGVREAVLLALLSNGGSSAPAVVLAALLSRGVGIVVELLAAGVSHLLAHGERRKPAPFAAGEGDVGS